jgi:tetratricopeptide (TPR) repeat protein
MKLNLNWQYQKWRAIGCLVLGQKKMGITAFEEMLVCYPNDSYVMMSLAHLYAEVGSKHDAILLYKQLVNQEKANASTWFNLGFMQEDAKQFEDAEHSFRKALSLDEDLDRAWYGLGLVLIQLNRLEEAVIALKRNTKLQPMSPYAWYQLARIHLDRHEPDEALKIIQHLKGFEPKVAAQLERETGLKTS